MHIIIIVKVTNTELQDINQLMSYRDAQWYIKDTWIGFSMRKIQKTDCSTSHFMAFQMMGCVKWWNYCLLLTNALENETFNRSQTWLVIYQVYLVKF